MQRESMCVCDIFFILLSISGQLGCSQILAMVNTAETDMGLQVSL